MEKEKRTSTRDKVGFALQAASAGISLFAMGGTAAAQSAQVQQAQIVTERECTLIILDKFEPTNDGSTPHGSLVRQAGETLGLPEHVEAVEWGDPYRPVVSESMGRLLAEFHRDGVTVEELNEALDTVIAERFIGFVDPVTNHLIGETPGTRNSAINISLGIDQADIVKALYRNFRPDTPVQNDDGTVQSRDERLQNAARVFGLDSDALLSEDETTRNRELGKLKQEFIDRVSTVIDTNTEVAASRQRWQDAVTSFESQNNSVVISGGNTASVRRYVLTTNGNHALTLPENFGSNFLEVDAVTSVGAIEERVAQNGAVVEIPAVYGNDSPGLDLWANGTLSLPNGESPNGTSISAPRVSTVMTEVHCENPTFTSSQVEGHVSGQFGRDMQPVAGHETVLDLELSRNLFAERYAFLP